MTRLLAILFVLCAPVMADEPKPVTLLDGDVEEYQRSHPDVAILCGDGWHVAKASSSDSMGLCLPDKPIVDGVFSIVDHGAQPMVRSHVIGTGKMRCTITGESAIADPKWSGIIEREFYIECEPVTEKQP